MPVSPSKKRSTSKNGSSGTAVELLPICFFGVVAGLAGLSYCWKLAAGIWPVNPQIANIIGVLSLLLFFLLGYTYFRKLQRHPDIYRAAFNDPESTHYFGILPICVLFLSGIFYPGWPRTAEVFWIAGASLVVLFAIRVSVRWANRAHRSIQTVPAYIIPVINLLDVTSTGAGWPLPWINTVCIVFFVIGLVSSLVLATLSIRRFYTHPLAKGQLEPSLLMLSGLFALVFLAYDSLRGKQDLFTTLFFASGVGLLLFFAGKYVYMLHRIPFTLTYWAITSPLIVLTVASFKYAARCPYRLIWSMPLFFLTISTLVLTILLLKTGYRLLGRPFIL
jgi:tellurite resistance protein